MVWFLENGDAMANDSLIPEGYTGTIIPEEEFYIYTHLPGSYLVENCIFIPKMTREQVQEVLNAEEEIFELKSYLNKTDYMAIKFAEGVMTAGEFEPVKTQRANCRTRINELQSRYNLS